MLIAAVLFTVELGWFLQEIGMEERAKSFAEAAHASIDQRRKYSGEPYITHPAAVVELVRSVPHTEAMICAAWLHDTVEDTPKTLADVERMFGAEIAELVEQLTDVSRPEDGNRRHRKAIDREHTAKVSAQAKTIKLADLIDNTRSIVERDPEFAKVYLAEKALLLEVLRDGDAAMWALAAGMVTPNAGGNATERSEGRVDHNVGRNFGEQQ